MVDPRMHRFIVRFQKAFQILKQEGLVSLYKKVSDKLLARKEVEKETAELTDVVYDETAIQFVGKKIESEQLLQRILTQAIGEMIFTISHDDYLTVVSGVQLRISDEQIMENKQGFSYLQIFPYQPRTMLDFSISVTIVGVNFDGNFLGFIEVDHLAPVLERLISEKLLKETRLHHLMSHKRDSIFSLLDIVKVSPIYFWLHDFFSICPNFPLLRNNKEYCHAPDPNSNACQVCIYGGIRPLHYEFFVELFKRYPIKVIAPSEFALKFWYEKFPIKGIEGSVSPNLKLEDSENRISKEVNLPLKIAYLGYPLDYKGWQTWLKLTEKLSGDTRYEFIYFSSLKVISRHFRQVSVETTAGNRDAMVKALKENDVQIAVLWSICPETFSFTLYESLAAGAYILTNPISGNICYYIQNNHRFGQVLNEADLFSQFESGSIIELVKQSFLDRPNLKLRFFNDGWGETSE